MDDTVSLRRDGPLGQEGMSRLFGIVCRLAAYDMPMPGFCRAPVA